MNRFFLCLFVMTAWAVALCTTSAHADELRMKNGLVLEGRMARVAGLNLATTQKNNSGPVPNFSYRSIDDGVRKYFVYRMQVGDYREAVPPQVESFQMKHRKSIRGQPPIMVGGFRSTSPFDQYGRRTVTLSVNGEPVPIIQAITDLKPDSARVEGLTHNWEYRLDTRFLPPEAIEGVIKQNVNPDNPSDRLSVIKFYIQAKMYTEAAQAATQLAIDHPEQKAQCEQLQFQIAELEARLGIDEIHRRRQSGQHTLAYYIAQTFPIDRVTADVYREAEEVVKEYDQAMADRDKALMLLGTLQMDIPTETSQRLSAMRAAIINEMHYESLPRLAPFLSLSEDETLPAEEKLALAYSGWVLGPDEAVLDLQEAIRLWDLRFLILDYLRNEDDSLYDAQLLDQLDAIDGASIERINMMVSYLPLPFDGGVITPGVSVEVDAAPGNEIEPVRYTLMLPPDYSPQHRYPLLVALKGPTQTFEEELRWWAGDASQQGWAQRRGYIVIAPHYCEQDETHYAASARNHDVVLKSLTHVRKRFRIDSDRIFLAGHGMGADACFDIGMSHPGIFAGVIPVVGTADRYCRYHVKNSPLTSWYIVSGERDRNTLEINAPIINDLMVAGHDVLFCLYKSRGFEPYYEEQARIFEWMQLIRRKPISETTRWKAESLRKSDNRFYWLEADDIPDRLYPPLSWEVPNRKVAQPYEAHITPGGTIYIRHPGNRTRIWLSPETFDFSKRCNIRINLKYVMNEYIKPSKEALLSDLRERGDRERLYWVRLEF